MTTPVSLIIIAHQNSITLPRALHAADLYTRAQDQKILVLNFPSPEVQKLAQSLDSSWQIVYEMNAKGPQHARNRGASVAKHDYLVFLDDDVELQAGWIERMLKGFTNPRVALGQGFISLEKRPGLFWNYNRYKNLKFFTILRKKKGGLRCDTAAIVVKKNWFQAIKGFDQDLNFGEDTFFVSKIASNGGISFFDMKITLNQIHNPHDGLLENFKKLKNAAPFQIMLLKKLNRPNIIYSENFLDNTLNGFKVPVSFLFLKFIFRIYYELCMNSLRDQLRPGGNELVLIRKAKLLDSSDGSTATTT